MTVGATTTTPQPHRQLLSGWGRTPRSAADVYAPANVEQVRAIVADDCGGSSRRVIARGLGRSYGDTALNAGGAVIDMTRVNGIRRIDLENGTVTAAGGVSLDALISLLVPLGLFLPVSPGTRFVTLGGALAADIHGKNHHVDGSIQEHIRAFRLMTANGAEIEVTRESQPDIFGATAGGLGLTGVITEVTLAMLPIESAYMQVDTERVPNLEAALDRFRDSDNRYRYSVAWTDAVATGRGLGRSVLLRANHAPREALPANLAVEPTSLHRPIAVTWPAFAPGGLLRRSTIAAFNELYFRRAPAQQRGAIEAMLPYFYPLDRVHHWNRAYGSRGFVQYQFVVPDGAEGALRAILAKLAAARCPSFLVVLKRMGPGHGMLSFPAPGWTLALDIPASADGLGELLDEIDRIVANAGGRIYLAKDARVQPALIREMYPDLPRWQRVRDELDPMHRFRSDLARRLELV